MTPAGLTTLIPWHLQPPGDLICRWFPGGEELSGVFGHGMSASQTGGALLAFGFIYFRVINNRELSNPNLCSL